MTTLVRRDNNPAQNNGDQTSEGSPDDAEDFETTQNIMEPQRLLRLIFCNDQGQVFTSETVLNDLVEVSVVEKKGIRERFLGHMQLEGYRRAAISYKKIQPLPLIAQARQIAIAFTETNEMISAQDVAAQLPSIRRTEIVKALGQLAKENKLIRVGHGIYSHPDRPKPHPDDIEQKRGKKGVPLGKRKKA